MTPQVKIENKTNMELTIQCEGKMAIILPPHGKATFDDLLGKPHKIEIEYGEYRKYFTVNTRLKWNLKIKIGVEGLIVEDKSTGQKMQMYPFATND